VNPVDEQIPDAVFSFEDTECASAAGAEHLVVEAFTIRERHFAIEEHVGFADVEGTLAIERAFEEHAALREG
jgi:hypothetical protein